jgi:hypothetical protein
MNLLEPASLWEMAKVMTMGATKYGSYSWKEGIEFSRLLAAALRHIEQYNNGENLDPESGISHIAHASCCLMMLLWMHINRTDLDDRHKGENVPLCG